MAKLAPPVGGGERGDHERSDVKLHHVDRCTPAERQSAYAVVAESPAVPIQPSSLHHVERPSPSLKHSSSSPGAGGGGARWTCARSSRRPRYFVGNAALALHPHVGDLLHQRSCGRWASAAPCAFATPLLSAGSLDDDGERKSVGEFTQERRERTDPAPAAAAPLTLDSRRPAAPAAAGRLALARDPGRSTSRRRPRPSSAS